MEYSISSIAGKNFVSLSAHPTKFWTGEVVSGNEALSRVLTLRDESETIGQDESFELVRFKKALSEEGKLTLTDIISCNDVDYILAPALFSTLVADNQLADLPQGKIVAFNATAETQRSAPTDKLGSSRLTLIW